MTKSVPCTFDYSVYESQAFRFLNHTVEGVNQFLTVL